MDSARNQIPGFSAIEQAANNLEGHIIKTPLLESELLNEEIGGRLLIKPEVLQKTASFKIRGAFNKILSIPSRIRSRGVVAFSSGNHAQAVATSARYLGIPATIIMPENAPELKINNTLGYGASVLLYNPDTQDRELIAEELAEKKGLSLIRPYDDYHIIAGQGTVGYEIFSQAKNLNLDPSAVVVPCGGGGLIAGTAIALKHFSPEIEVWSAEPENFNDTKRSLEQGTRLKNNNTIKSICDSILTPTPGKLTFEINSNLLTGGVDVTDAEVKSAMLSAFRHFKLVVEPGGAVALSAILSGKIPIKGRTIIAILSGGNVDMALYSKIMNESF
ncbi:threonine/serine dehydratase [Pseudomaricurvus alkylphenolicus]|uniref:threonine/serine dehydratase n=1 Tax=Pseudomaricurvus alkylphenolicus TaxID=1306991 RepID=UPI0014203E32|nr:threonine/serine dehydratase [Pseudomaricurvus alkylphenolicus]NIB42469.1 threonine/serine dehydratase [Pseudomaricurvus alkylphenolicus]